MNYMRSIFALFSGIIALVFRYIIGIQQEREQIFAKIRLKLKSLGLTLSSGISRIVISVIIILICIKLSKS